MKRKKLSIIILVLVYICISCDSLHLSETNNSPNVELSTSKSLLLSNETLIIKAIASDSDQDELTYTWYIDGVDQINQQADTLIFSAQPSTQTDYEISVTVSDGLLTATDTVTITVQAQGDINSPPTVEIIQSKHVLAFGEEIVLSTVASDSDQDELTYIWNVDGIDQINQQSETLLFSAQPSIQTDYEISVTVSDGLFTATYSVTITVQALGDINSPPSVEIMLHKYALAFGEEIVLSTAASDSDLDDLTYTWFIDGVVQINQQSDSLLFSAQPSIQTDYEIAVTVSNGLLSASDSVTITVQAQGDINSPPTVEIIQGKQVLAFGEEIVFSTAASDSNQNELTYTWHIDGVDQINQQSDSLLFSAQPSIQTDYEIAVTVSDGLLSASDSVTITVQALGDINSPPTVEIIQNKKVLAFGEEIVLSTAASDSDQDYLTYTWYIDSIEQISQYNDSLVFSAQPSTQTDYGISVIVSDGLLTATDTVNITVEEQKEPLLFYLEGNWKQSYIPLPANIIDIVSVNEVLYVLTKDNEIFYYEDLWRKLDTTLPNNSKLLSVSNNSLMLVTVNEEIFIFDNGNWRSLLYITEEESKDFFISTNTIYFVNESGNIFYFDGVWTQHSVSYEIETHKACFLDDYLYILDMNNSLFYFNGVLDIISEPSILNIDMMFNHNEIIYAVAYQ